MTEDRTYRLEPLDTSGVFLGLGVAQSVLMGGGIVITVVAVTAGLPVLISIVPVLGGAVLSFVSLDGHPLWEWAPLGLRWWWRGVVRGRQWMAPLSLWPTDANKVGPLPPCLAGVELVEVPWRAMTDFAAVADRQAGTLAAVVPVEGGQFALEPRTEQDRLLSSWGDLLAQFAGDRGAVAHLTWSAVTRPSGLVGHVDWRRSNEQKAESRDSSVYDELVTTAAEASTHHEVLVTITVEGRHSGRRRRSPEAQHGERFRALVNAVESLLRGLGSAGLHPGDPLGARAMYRLLRLRADPTLASPGRHGGRLADRLGLIGAASAGPLVLETHWRQIRVDSAWHRTYWVSRWPATPVPPSWLESFLAGPHGICRTMTVSFQPVPGHQARRRIERDLVKFQSDADSKEEKGRRVDARHQRATEALLAREQELVAGFAEMAYVGLVTVSARTLEELDEHGEIVEQTAREVGMELRLIDGRQDEAWAAALPLGLAARKLLAS